MGSGDYGAAVVRGRERRRKLFCVCGFFRDIRRIIFCGLRAVYGETDKREESEVYDEEDCKSGEDYGEYTGNHKNSVPYFVCHFLPPYALSIASSVIWYAFLIFCFKSLVFSVVVITDYVDFLVL